MFRRISLFLAVLVAAALLVWAGPGELIGQFFEFLRDRLVDLQTLARDRPVLSASIFFAAYAACVAVSIPVAAIMTPAAGAIFGLVTGTLLASFASTIGATILFVGARFVFRDLVEKRFRAIFDRVNRGIEQEGAYYLFALRLVPIFPFFAVNLATSLTRLPVWTYYWVSQLGMLPGTAIFVNAGVQLGRIETPGDVLSPQLLGSLALLGIFPLLARRLSDYVATRRLLSRHRRPSKFDANVIVIGAGSAGLVTAYVAAAAKARVVLIEADEMGGDCLNRGCVPSKALIRSARVAADIRRAAEFGLRVGSVGVDFPQVMQRVQDVIARIEPHDSVQRYTALGVECVKGAARMTSPWSVEVAGRTITARSIVVATGGIPAIPPIPGLADVPYVTSDSLWQVERAPQRLLVLGGGPIGCELAQAFRRLGSEVVLVELLPRLLVREEEAASVQIAERFSAEGIRVLTGHRALAFRPTSGGAAVRCRDESTGAEIDVEFDLALVAVGRKARTAGFGLEELGVRLNANGTLAVNDYLQATFPNIYACGDVTGPYQLTHAAAHQAWYCAMNALYGRFWRLAADYRAIPWATFTDPEVARVGLTELEARERGLDIETSTYDIGDLDRAIADGEAVGFVKVITPRNSDKILGVTIVGPHAGNLLAEFVLAMRHGLGLRKILGTVHIYPTLAEANKFAAGVWQRAHLPSAVLRIAERINRWQRG